MTTQDIPLPTPESQLFRDLSTLDTNELVLAVVGSARMCEGAVIDGRARSITPGDLPQTDVVESFHSRLQRVQQVEQMSPLFIGEKITSGLKRLYPDNKNLHEGTLDTLINKVGPRIASPQILNELGLTKNEQLLFVRGIIIATSARYYEASRGGKPYSDRQRRLQRAARSHLEHLATNRVHVPASDDAECVEKFAISYSAAYLAGRIAKEVHGQQPGRYNTTSVMSAMELPIEFGRLQSGDAAEVLAIFPPGHHENDVENDGTEYIPRLPSEIDETRIVELRALQDSLNDPHAIFRYYETVKPFRRSSEGGEGAPRPRKTREEQDVQDEEEAEYVVLTIQQTDDDGRPRTHVVAEHPQVGNACYALRDEILDEWERLLGVRLSWPDVFSQSRQTARQLGARDFRHNQGSNVPKRVRDYLKQDPASVIMETFDKIFETGEKELFDEDLQPTRYNHLPSMLKHHITNSAALRELWLTIREHGYDQTYRMLTASETARVRKERNMTPARAEEAVRPVSLRQRAADMWAAIIDAERTNLHLED